MATNNEIDANARTSTATARTITLLLLERIGNIVRGMFYVNRPIHQKAKTKPRHWGAVGGVPGSYATRP
jgi:hypothetical protein